MESELDLLLGRAIDSLPKLEILVYFLRDGENVQTPAQIAVQLRRPAGEVTTALEELSQAGLVDRFALGTGRHVLYGAREDAHVQKLLQVLYTRYQDPDARGHLVRRALGQDGSSAQSS